ncbi:MAG: peptigoglycan-binding protein LysM [Erythrobacteraceae bacterium]|nr:peptigoglycan-binding protein LysM [Erythrobacteraceae bacterium]
MTQDELQLESLESGEERRQTRRLVLCFDGSWNKLDSSQHPTNVVLLAESVPPVDRDGRDQIVYYDEGVGTASDETFRGGAFGKGLVANVQEAYRFLIFNYRPGDEIFVFGFSRGAFTARTFIGFIKCAGIISVADASQLRRAWELYGMHANRDADEPEELLEFRRRHCPASCVSAAELAWRRQDDPSTDAEMVKVRYCGVWDTVGSLGWKAIAATFDRRKDKRYSDHDTQLSDLVEAGRHAVAIDERRGHFMPTLWRNVRELNVASGHDPYSTEAPYQQKWFAGDHGSVGGGGPERGLSNAALHWVLKGAIEMGLEVDLGGRSQLDDIRYRADAPLTNTPQPLAEQGFSLRRSASRVLSAAKDQLLTADRSGPVEAEDIHPSALRRWFLPGSSLGGADYRPAPLAPLERSIEAGRQLFDPLGKADLPTYVVAPGESLWRIARRILKDSDRHDEIFALNRDLLDHPGDIFPGDVLRMPKDAAILSPEVSYRPGS